MEDINKNVADVQPVGTAGFTVTDLELCEHTKGTLREISVRKVAATKPLLCALAHKM
jgi:hypothetical protein